MLVLALLSALALSLALALALLGVAREQRLTGRRHGVCGRPLARGPAAFVPVHGRHDAQESPPVADQPGRELSDRLVFERLHQAVHEEDLSEKLEHHLSKVESKKKKRISNNLRLNETGMKDN